MRLSASILLLQVVAVSAADLNNLQALICELTPGFVRRWRDPADATAYCASVLEIPTSTVTATVTEPSGVYPTTTRTETVTSSTTTISTMTETTSEIEYISTVTTTIFTPVEETTTVIAATTTTSCLSEAYIYTPPVGTIPVDKKIKRAEPTQAPVKRKRQACGCKREENWSPEYVRSACLCLDIPTPTVISTSTFYDEALETVTELETSTTWSTFQNPTSTETTVVTETILTTSTVEETTGTPFFVTAIATETAIARNGLSYKRYIHGYNEVLDTAQFSPSVVLNEAPEDGGTSQTLTFSSEPDGSLTLDVSFNAFQAAVLFQGFFIAPETGTFSFSTAPLNPALLSHWAYLYSGDNAYEPGDTNYDYRAVGGASVSPGYSYIPMNKGDAIPISFLWANGGGFGSSEVGILFPSFSYVDSAHWEHFVQACEGPLNPFGYDP